MPITELFILTLGFTIVLMYWVWLWAVKVENFSLVDAAWSGGFLIQALFFFSYGQGALSRKVLFFLMIAAWSARLTTYLSKRIYGHHPVEDTRYLQLRNEYGSNYKNRFLKFYMIQAVSISVLTFPFIFVFQNQNVSLGLSEYAGLILFVISLAGESVADHQMKMFKLKPENKGLVCNIGLWKYSRHPNYFFESCIWFSFFIFMCGTGLWWSIYAPLCILFLLLKVTGVPPSEAQSLKSRPDTYREYQRKTSVFIPWFPKE